MMKQETTLADLFDGWISRPRARISIGVVLVVALAAGSVGSCRPGQLAAQVVNQAPDRGAESKTTVLGEGYEHGRLGRFFFGTGYRDLWATEIEVPVLDLDGTAGGLTPVAKGGYGQTLTLEFVGSDGLTYAVRSIDKDLTRRLDSLFVGTVVATIVQNQVGQFLPTAGLVVDPLLDAVGILHPTHRLVRIPDHPGLGRYRAEFAGFVGMFVDRPQGGPGGSPGFAGSTRIVGTDELLERLAEGACARADAQEYLKARLVDMLVGDRDRHEGQWRWARFPTAPGCEVWRPVPEDRDEAFVMNDGFMMSLVRLVRPQQVRFGPEYPSVLGLTYNGWELDRRILAELDEPDWRATAERIRRELPDEVIDAAVRRLPPPHFSLRGEFLAMSLKARRDALVEEALAFYELISTTPQIEATDRSEVAILEHRPGGDLDVSIRYASDAGEGSLTFRRRFRAGVTDEVRVFLKGGDDVAEIRGARGPITVRVIGGAGDDRLVNASHAPRRTTHFYDAEGDNSFEGEATVDGRPYVRPQASNLVHRYALDWGGLNRYLPQFAYDPDLGVSAGLAVGVQRFGFRKAPWESDNVFRAAVASNGPNAYLGWAGHFRDVVWGADLTFDAEYSGLDVLRFYGFGNDTPVESPSDFYRVDQRSVRFSPGLEWSWGHLDRGDTEIDLRQLRPVLAVRTGPTLELSDTPLDSNSDRFIGSLDPPPPGVGTFGQIGGRLDVELDTRDRPGYASEGSRVNLGGSAFPAIWDADRAFGEVHGTASTYLTPGGHRSAPTLALRAGGRRVFGGFPYHEAAYVGGSRDLRGFRSGRFAGDASIFGNAELRVPVSRFFLLFPTEVGVHGAADVGRVFLDDASGESNVWHTGFGGGIWLSWLNRTQALGITVMHGADLTGLYVQAGLHF
ncbi:MAG: hypothetical protein R3195_03845 [Gemmatimonadota bacterium]|nr:hypothetical protein [Gemmatimonadota bacterium]